VKVQTGGDESFERSGRQADVTITVEEQVLKLCSPERIVLDRLYTIIAHVQPFEVTYVREYVNFDLFNTAFAKIQMLEFGKLGEV